MEEVLLLDIETVRQLVHRLQKADIIPPLMVHKPPFSLLDFLLLLPARFTYLTLTNLLPQIQNLN